MNELRNQSDGSVVIEPVFRRLVNASLPTPLTAESANLVGYDLLLEGHRPGINSVYEQTVRDGEEEIDSKWYTKYKIVTLDAVGVDSSKASAERKQRDELLSRSDWTQLADSTADKAAWATYRAALRDLPSAEGFPHTITWPKEPS